MHASQWVFFVCLIFEAAQMVLTSDMMKPEVTTKLGTIQGQRVVHQKKKVDQYLSVPYATAPLGDLRFKRTVPLTSYNQTIKAYTMPPACQQHCTGPFPWYDDKPGKSEDCLYLNIWVPRDEVSSENKAVMYWIYGGGFFIGSIRDPIYDGKALAATGDVIVVTVNYRLSSFGFIYSGTDDAPGNVGLYDVLEGLKWVNENIQAFGGDKDKITIMGESAGAIIAGILAVSPLTKGMYKRIIAESATQANILSSDPNVNLNLSQMVAKAVNCANDSYTIENHPEEVVKCLRSVDAVELAEQTALLKPHVSRIFLPQHGDDLIPRAPVEAVRQGEFYDSELLIGSNMDESVFSLTTGNPDMFGFFGEEDPRVDKSYARNLLNSLFSSLDDPASLVSYYIDSVSDDDYDAIRKQTYYALSDYVLLCPCVFLAEKYAEKMNDVYYYFFVHRPSTTPWAQWMGVVHYEEVQFVFGQPTIHPDRYTTEEKTLSEKMMTLWAEFAKTGSPGDGWPLYSKENPSILLLNATSSNEYGSGPHRDNCDALRPYFGF